MTTALLRALCRNWASRMGRRFCCYPEVLFRTISFPLDVGGAIRADASYASYAPGARTRT